MSMFDDYRPVPEHRCPVCRRPLTHWQGKDGPNGLLLWVEGTRAPVDQAVDDDLRLDEDARARLALPPRFVIYSHDCPEHHPVVADCAAPSGLWTETILRPFRPRVASE